MDDFTMSSTDTQCRVVMGHKLTAVLASRLQEALKNEIAKGVREILFDLGMVNTIDSTGIGLLIAASNSMAEIQGGVRLVNVPPEIMKLLRSMRLAERLNATEKDGSHGA